jgi:[acyl-carrier-protein] S-malonyltransferase
MKYNRITAIFPGQGSQYTGMGKELYENFDIVRKIYDEANAVLEYDLAGLCFRKSGIVSFGSRLMHKPDLNKTIYTQPAVLTTSYACFKALEETCKKRGIELNFCLLAGHSLGEYTALLASGAIDFRTCLQLVNKRAQYMTELGRSYPGAGLMAVMSRSEDLDFQNISSICNEFQVYVTLNNTKRQIVVGGGKRKLELLSKELKNQNKIGKMLKVEGPFHTPIMKPAAEQFKKELERSRLVIASRPIIANVSTNAIVDPNHIKKELYNQIFNIVDWRRSVEKIVVNGGDLFIEIGPKRVLSNMVKDIDPSIPELNVEDMESLENTVVELERAAAM